MSVYFPCLTWTTACFTKEKWSGVKRLNGIQSCKNVFFPCFILHFQQQLDAFPKLHPTAPPEGRVWDCGFESPLCVSMPDRQVLSVPVRQDFLIADVLASACKVYPHLVILQKCSKHLNQPCSESALLWIRLHEGWLGRIKLSLSYPDLCFNYTKAFNNELLVLFIHVALIFPGLLTYRLRMSLQIL